MIKFSHGKCGGKNQEQVGMCADYRNGNSLILTGVDTKGLLTPYRRAV